MRVLGWTWHEYKTTPAHVIRLALIEREVAGEVAKWRAEQGGKRGKR